MLKIGLVLLIICSVANIAVPYFFGVAVDAAAQQTPRDLAKMTMYVLIMFAVSFVGAVAGGFRSWIFDYAGQRVLARLRHQVFQTVVEQDISYFDRKRSGVLITRIANDHHALQNAVTQNLSLLVRYLEQVVGSLIFMFTLDPALTGWCLLYSLFFVLNLLSFYDTHPLIFFVLYKQFYLATHYLVFGKESFWNNITISN